MKSYKAGADVNAADEKGITPLQNASVNPLTDNLAYLLFKGANIRAQNKFGMTALHYSVKSGCGRNSYLLAEKGADLDCKDKKGLSPRDIAKQSSDPDIVEIFRFLEEEVS